MSDFNCRLWVNQERTWAPFFYQIKFIVFERVQLKKTLLSYSATSFFHRYIPHGKFLIAFVYSSIPVGFRAISMLFLSFLSQKTYPDKFLRPDIILSRSYLRKCSIWPCPYIINLSFFKNDIKSEPLRVRG